ncbi:MAG: Rad52/Rad22 family DNA repair protein [Gemmataceae bacterium]
MSMLEMADALARPFEPHEVTWKAQAVSKDGQQALAVPYLNARACMDRLDEVFGFDGWKDAYHVLPDGCVVCRLSVRVDGGWVSKTDVGEPGQDHADFAKKAAFSDALKRAAVKLGIGRYLYRLPKQWVAWDSQRKTFKTQPRLPTNALPPSQPAPALPANSTSRRRNDYVATGPVGKTEPVRVPEEIPF